MMLWDPSEAPAPSDLPGTQNIQGQWTQAWLSKWVSCAQPCRSYWPKETNRGTQIGRGKSGLKMEGCDPKEPEQLRKLFLVGLSFEATNNNLREHFEKWGTVTDCVVMKDPPNGMFQRLRTCDLLLCWRVDAAMRVPPHKADGCGGTEEPFLESPKSPGARGTVKKNLVV